MTPQPNLTDEEILRHVYADKADDALAQDLAQRLERLQDELAVANAQNSDLYHRLDRAHRVMGAAAAEIQRVVERQHDAAALVALVNGSLGQCLLSIHSAQTDHLCNPIPQPL